MKSVNTDIAYAHIRSRILSGEWPPGQSLMTVPLAEEIGVSRTPVRDALRKLEADGLVDIEPRLGAKVKETPLGEFRDLSELRSALEVQAAGLAATRRTEADLAEIREAFAAMDALTPTMIRTKGRRSVIDKVARHDVRFHLAIVAAAHNEIMQREILRLALIHQVALNPLGKRIGAIYTPDQRVQNHHRSMSEHEAVLQAIERGDVRAARQAMEHHLALIIETTLRTIERSEKAQRQRDLTPEELVSLV
jgi:DNA-binding GntR family transcriptional regulator